MSENEIRDKLRKKANKDARKNTEKDRNGEEIRKRWRERESVSQR